ncbi:hypothetical protein FLK61_34985 [Paenalkalicoccus suaedae]|uniref:Uncharacterized protein n=1 Tax=Paenalkalicoccus suaedae TaxID=2592382 RepID=A0A859FI20_9BACI|nr:hypothetical protein [Paenalkalicoccus suaedae]QKS71875.1 hypothetical protein FLK61_34985 [Paenalkalicoccus suaedae]
MMQRVKQWFEANETRYTRIAWAYGVEGEKLVHVLEKLIERTESATTMQDEQVFTNFIEICESVDSELSTDQIRGRLYVVDPKTKLAIVMLTYGDYSLDDIDAYFRAPYAEKITRGIQYIHTCFGEVS